MRPIPPPSPSRLEQQLAKAVHHVRALREIFRMLADRREQTGKSQAGNAATLVQELAALEQQLTNAVTHLRSVREHAALHYNKVRDILGKI